MAAVVIFTLTFVLGVVLIGILQFAFERVHRRVALPMGALNAVLTGVCFLVTIPFVTSILVRSQGWAFETFAVMGAIFLCAAVAFAIGLVQMFRWTLRRPRETHA